MERYQRPKASSAAAKKRMQSTRQKNTSAEVRLRSELHRLGLRFRLNKRLIPKLRRTVDIVFSKIRLAVFVDGCFWHGCPQHATCPKSNSQFWLDKIKTNMQRDLDTNRRLEELGWKVIRIWEHEDPKDAAQKIYRIVRERCDLNCRCRTMNIRK